MDDSTLRPLFDLLFSEQPEDAGLAFALADACQEADAAQLAHHLTLQAALAWAERRRLARALQLLRNCLGQGAALSDLLRPGQSFIEDGIPALVNEVLRLRRVEEWLSMVGPQPGEVMDDVIVHTVGSEWRAGHGDTP